jgi:hypothetical protein
MTPVLSADNVTDVKANQNLFSDLSRNMTIENSQDNSSSNDNSTSSSDNSTSIPEPGPSSD